MILKNWLPVVVASVLLSFPIKAEAIKAGINGCELHVWPSKIFTSYNVNVNVMSAGAGYFSVGTSLEPISDVDPVLSKNLSESAQNNIIRGLVTQPDSKFKNHELIFHPAPDGPKHGNWLVRDAGYGARDTTSSSVCYSELHVLFLTYFTNTLGGKIQTTLLYRDFGRDETTERVTKAMMNYKAGAFPAKKPEHVDLAQHDAQDAFSKGITKFLNKKSVRK